MNPYAAPSDRDSKPGRTTPAGVSIRGILAGLGSMVLIMLLLGLAFGIGVVLQFGPEALSRHGDSPFAAVRHVPYAQLFSLGFWTVGCFCGGFVSARFSSDRQIVQGLAVGVVALTFVTIVRNIASPDFRFEDFAGVFLASSGDRRWLLPETRFLGYFRRTRLLWKIMGESGASRGTEPL